MQQRMEGTMTNLISRVTSFNPGHPEKMQSNNAAIERSHLVRYVCCEVPKGQEKSTWLSATYYEIDLSTFGEGAKEAYSGGSCKRNSGRHATEIT